MVSKALRIGLMRRRGGAGPTPDTIVSVVAGTQTNGTLPVTVNVTGLGVIEWELRDGVTVVQSDTATIDANPDSLSIPLIDGLSGSNFTFYVQNIGNTSNAVSGTFSLDTVKAVLSGPGTTNITDTTVTGTFTSDTAGETNYGVITFPGDPDPDADQIIAETDGGDGPVQAAANDSPSIVGSNSLAFTGLVASTNYKAHFTSKDAQGNKATPVRTTFATVAAGSFDPIDLFQASEWGAVYYDTPAYLFKDAAKTQPVTTDGDLVYVRADASANGLDMVQSDSALRPVYRTNGTLHKLEWGGGIGGTSISSMATSASANNAQANLMRAVAMKANDGAGEGTLFPTNTNTEYAGLYRNSGTGTPDSNAGGAVTYRANGSDVTAPVGTDDLATAWHINAMMAALAENIDFSPASIALQFGQSATSPHLYFAYNGETYGEVIRVGTLTTQQRSDLETWLMAKTAF